MAADLREDARNFADQSLQFSKRDYPNSAKIIHDGVWGPIRVRPHEVALLDSPLLQRLRYLHQTGFAFLTFPSAGHSRFEHSLGVLRQTDHYLQALRGNFPEHVTEEVIANLRLAALLHDCTHGMFSHTSEQVYGLLPDMLEYTSSGREYAGHKPSELIARFVLESDAFQRALDFLATMGAAIHTSGSELATLITGDREKSPPHDVWQLEIINGPLDADKLDYVPRDALHTGIPSSLDLERFWNAMEIQHIKKGTFSDVKRDETRLVLNHNGINALEQILLARVQNTSSLYHHHKVRACDCVFKSWIEKNQKEGKFRSTIEFIKATDLDFLISTTDCHRSKLLKRAAVISASTVKFDSEEFKNLQDRLKDNKPDASQELRGLALEIAEEAKVPEESKELVWIDLPPTINLEQLGKTIINKGTKEKPSFHQLQEEHPLGTWIDNYDKYKWKGHIFCLPEHVESVKKAAKDVLESRYTGLKILPGAFTMCKQEPPL